MQEAVRLHGWEISIETVMRPVAIKDADRMPDLVILDGFPESKIAGSAYYQLQYFGKVRFLALNDSPNAIKFLHVNALSFIKMINRNPDPKELVNAIFDLVASNRKMSFQRPETIYFEKKSYRCRLTNLCDLQNKACC